MIARAALAGMLLVVTGTLHAQTAPTTPQPAAQQAAAPVAPPAPAELFKTVCLGGSARLSRKWAASATLAELPSAARDMLIHGTGRIKPLSPAEVPNPIFRIGATDYFLLIPTAESVEGSPFADSCAVIWKGSDYAAARNVLPAGFADQNPGSFASTPVNDRQLSAGMSKGWTVLRLEGASAAPGAAPESN